MSNQHPFRYIANLATAEVIRQILALVNMIAIIILDSLRGSSVKHGTIQRILAWPLRKDDTHTSRSVNSCMNDYHLRQAADAEADMGRELCSLLLLIRDPLSLSLSIYIYIYTHI